MGTINIYLFGNFRLIRHQTSVFEIRFTPNLKGLLSYLVLYRHRLHSREVLAGIFWGEAEQERARHNLNTAVWRLRQLLEPPGIPKGTYLLSDGAGEIGFNNLSNYWLDVEVFEKKTEQILAKPFDRLAIEDALELEGILKLYTGKLLEGFYGDWALQEQERLHGLYLECLAHLMHYYRYIKAYAKSLAFGKMILGCEPLREEIHRKVMKIYLESGNRSMALQHYQTCSQILKRELNVPPMEETQVLYKFIKKMEQGAHVTGDPERPQSLKDASATKASREQAIQDLLLALEHVEETREKLIKSLKCIEAISSPK